MVYTTARQMEYTYKHQLHGLSLICFVENVPKRENEISLEVKSY